MGSEESRFLDLQAEAEHLISLAPPERTIHAAAVLETARRMIREYRGQLAAEAFTIPDGDGG